jgi:hypothetical protein
MSDQQGGQSENGSKPEFGPDALSGTTRSAPVIQGEAFEVPTSADTELANAAPPKAEPSKESPPQEPDAIAVETQRKDFRWRPLVATAGACAIGVVGYYGWTEWASPPPPKFVPVVATAPKTVEARPKAEENVEPSAEKAAPPAVVSTPSQALAAPPPLAAEELKKAQAPVEPKPVAPAKSDVVETKPAEAPPTESATEKALAEMTARLASTQAALEQLTQRLQAVEGQLAAPKTESRAELAAREAGPSNAGDVSARIVAAQSMLSAIRQGDDYAPMLTALQSFGGDSDRLARLRAGLGAPSAGQLAKDFAALAPKILADAAPPAREAPQAKAPQSFGETILTFLESRAAKLVRIRPAGAPNDDATGARIERIEKDLARGDLAGALAERSQFPAPALALTADWAAAAQTRLDAEQAAKAELAAALQGLSKRKS